MGNHSIDLVRAVADIIGNTGDEHRAAELVAAWGEAVRKKAIEDAAAVCTDMLDRSDWGLDRERTVGLARHRIKRLLERKWEHLGQTPCDCHNKPMS